MGPAGPGQARVITGAFEVCLWGPGKGWEGCGGGDGLEGCVVGARELQRVCGDGVARGDRHR